MNTASASNSSSEDRIRTINILIGLKKEADLQTLKIEGHLQELEVEYQREVNSASIIRGLDGYLGIRSSGATPMNSSVRVRRPSALAPGLREEDRIFTRAALLPARHTQRDTAAASTASSADDDFDRDRGGTEDDELEEEPTEDDSDYEGGGGSSSHRRRQR